MGTLDRRDVEAVGVDVEVIDATGCAVIPGLLDPHQHLVGESDAGQLGVRSSEVHLADLAAAGITAAVGCLGTDVGTMTMEALLAKAKALRQGGVDVRAWTGGSRRKPTLLQSACADLVTFKEIIGAGEVPDFQGAGWDTGELASLASDAYLGGTLSGKAGVTHFHVDTRSAAVAPLREALRSHHVPPDRICFIFRDLRVCLRI